MKKQTWARYSKRHVWHAVSHRDSPTFPWVAILCMFPRYFMEADERTTKPKGRICRICARRLKP